MGLFNRLPGFERAPAGLGGALNRRLPWFAGTGTVVLGCLIVVIAKGPLNVADARPVPAAEAPLRRLVSI